MWPFRGRGRPGEIESLNLARESTELARKSTHLQRYANRWAALGVLVAVGSFLASFLLSGSSTTDARPTPKLVDVRGGDLHELPVTDLHVAVTLDTVVLALDVSNDTTSTVFPKQMLVKAGQNVTPSESCESEIVTVKLDPLIVGSGSQGSFSIRYADSHLKDAKFTGRGEFFPATCRTHPDSLRLIFNILTSIDSGQSGRVSVQIPRVVRDEKGKEVMTLQENYRYGVYVVDEKNTVTASAGTCQQSPGYIEC